MSTHDLHTYVIKNPVLEASTSKAGFRTFKEPILTNWKQYHLRNAQLQEISKEDHKRLTLKIKRSGNINNE